MVRAIKLAAKDLKYPLNQLLSNLGAVYGDRAYTGYVFLAEDDLKVIRRNYRQSVRSSLPKAKKAVVDALVLEHFAQFETNQSLAQVVKPGYVLVDFDGISLSIRRIEQREQLDKAIAEGAERRRVEAEMAAAEAAKYRHAFLPKSVVKFFVDNFGEPKRS